MDKIDLSPNEHCDPSRDWTYIHMAMHDWEKTNSPAVYWHRKLFGYEQLWKTYSLPETMIEGHLTGKINMTYGLPTAEAMEVCKMRFRYEIAKVTVEIASPDVMEIVKDVRVTFADQLGAIGENLCVTSSISILLFIHFRRHIGSLLRHQYHQHGRGCLLAL